MTLHDGVPVPKVIDFGIAKATQGRLTDQTLFTAFEQFIGTPAYMSPEQAEMSGLDIDTRSDIYALGVSCTNYSRRRCRLIPKNFYNRDSMSCAAYSRKRAGEAFHSLEHNAGRRPYCRCATPPIRRAKAGRIYCEATWIGSSSSRSKKIVPTAMKLRTASDGHSALPDERAHRGATAEHNLSFSKVGAPQPDDIRRSRRRDDSAGHWLDPIIVFICPGQDGAQTGRRGRESGEANKRPGGKRRGGNPPNHRRRIAIDAGEI